MKESRLPNIMSCAAGKIKGMTFRPSYYSGRGETADDLNSEILERLYQWIKDSLCDLWYYRNNFSYEYYCEVRDLFEGIDSKAESARAARNFVNFVATLTDLSMTSFLENLHLFASNNYEIPESLLTGDVCIPNEDHENERMVIGMITAVEKFHSSQRRELPKSFTQQRIRGAFLRAHSAELSPKLKRELSKSTMYL